MTIQPKKAKKMQLSIKLKRLMVKELLIKIRFSTMTIVKVMTYLMLAMLKNMMRTIAM